MKFQVQIHHSDQTEAIDASRLTKAIRMMALDVRLEQGRVSIAILSDPEMKELNRQYLDHDYETDVISFNLSDDDDFFDGELLLGADTARRVAAEVGWRPEDELLLYAIHGMLHLLGYEDDTPKQRDEMRVQERHYLQALRVKGWERHPTHGEAHSDSNGDSHQDSRGDGSSEEIEF